MPTKRGIETKIVIGLVAIATSALMVSAITLGVLRAVREDLTYMTRNRLPAVIAVARLHRISERMTNKAPALVLARNDLLRRTMIEEMREEVRERETILEELRNFGESAQDLKTMSEHFNLLLDNLNMLDQTTEVRMAAMNRMNTHAHQAQRILRELESLTDTVADRRMLAPMEGLRRWTRAILSAQFVEDANELMAMDRGIRTSAHYMSAWDIPENARRLLDEFYYYGASPDNAFQARLQELGSRKKIGELLDRHSDLSEMLGFRVDQIFKRATGEARERAKAFEGQFSALTLATVAIPAVTLLVIGFIYVVIRLSLINRLVKLEQVMDKQARGEYAPIPMYGHDEVASMARALNSFVDYRRRIEATLRKEIEARILTEEALRQAKDAAEAAYRAKSSFLANMSHELRTPLNAIIGFAQVLARDTNIPEPTRQNASIIFHSGKHLLTMINDILDLSKIEADKMEIRLVIFDLLKTLFEITEMLHHRAQAKGLSMEIRPEIGMHRFIRADLGKLRQILINLVGNAVKFTSQGGVWLVGRTRPHDAGPQYCWLEIEVRDTGCGIPTDSLDDIFEPFTQLEPSQFDRQGTGLGLTISRSFVQLMGGEITVNSQLGTGTTFRIRLPVETTTGEELIADVHVASQTSLSAELPIPSPKELAAMSPELRRRIHQAAQELKKAKVMTIAAELDHEHRTVAAFLRNRAEQYDFASVTALVESNESLDE